MFEIISFVFNQIFNVITICMGFLIVLLPLFILSSLFSPRVYVVIKERDNHDSRI